MGFFRLNYFQSDLNRSISSGIRRFYNQMPRRKATLTLCVWPDKDAIQRRKQKWLAKVEKFEHKLWPFPL